MAAQASLLIDVSRLVDRGCRGHLPTGVDRVCLEYVRHFGHRAQAVLRWRSWRRILPRHLSVRLFALLTNRTGPTLPNEMRWLLARASMQTWLPQHGAGRVYFNHGHSGIEDPGSRDWLRRTGQKPVYMLHDLIPVTHGEYCRPGEFEKHSNRLRTMLTHSAGIITNSDHTLQELKRFADAQGLLLPPAKAAPLAPAQLPVAAGPAPLDRPYFVMLGTIEPRKNHLLLLHLWRDLVQQLGADAPHLVLIGQRGWECENVVDMLDRCRALRGFVHELPSCSDPELSRWLGHAQALLFPSFAEGYGMPLAESLMLGTPVIASDLPSFREFAQSVPDYLHPLDGASWREAILDFAANGPRRQAQLQRLQSFQCPTWDQHFALVEDFLERLQ